MSLKQFAVVQGIALDNLPEKTTQVHSDRLIGPDSFSSVLRTVVGWRLTKCCRKNDKHLTDDVACSVSLAYKSVVLTVDRPLVFEAQIDKACKLVLLRRVDRGQVDLLLIITCSTRVTRAIHEDRTKIQIVGITASWLLISST